MIKNLISNSPLIYVSNNSSPYINMSNPSAGMMRYNGNSSSLEVYDGSSWMQMSNSASISVDTRLDTVVNWAVKKIAEEREELELRKHPLAKDAYETYQTTLELVKKHNIGETL